VLEARRLRLCTPDGMRALDDLTAFGHPGEVLALIGGHGAGKSAFLRSVAGLVRPDAGAIRLDGADVTALGAHARADRIRYVADGCRVLGRLSVRENLLVGAWRRRDRRAVARDYAAWLDRFPALAAAPLRPAAELPPAARMALALGRAWLGAPRVLLVEEPFTGLDGQGRAGIAAALRAACDAGLIVICAMQEPGDLSIANRVNVLANGRIVFSGSPAAVATAGAAALSP
jgi:branched-chain amino acid transport system ATP-binding protein